MRFLRAASIILLCGLGPAGAQDLSGIPFIIAQQNLPVAVVDMEQLFSMSDYGKAVQNLIAGERRSLAAENRVLESELEAEAADLAARRPELAPEEFRLQADQFDQRVQAIRLERDARQRQVEQLINASEQRFNQIVTPLLSKLMSDRHTLLLLDRRMVAAVDPSLDLTEEAITEVNRQLREGVLAVPSIDEIPAAQADVPPESLPETATPETK